LIRASIEPLANRSLIWFTVWSSVAHALVIAASALTDRTETGHLAGDRPALLLLAIALATVTRRAETKAVPTVPDARRVA
jgi:hypothetical protein